MRSRSATVAAIATTAACSSTDTHAFASPLPQNAAVPAYQSQLFRRGGVQLRVPALDHVHVASASSSRRLRVLVRLAAGASPSDRSTADHHDYEEENVVKPLRKRLTREFLTIGAPAFVQLAAEPLASLVDTAYLGRLGPEVLGGAGVAISAQYAVSKLYNDPLLRTSISLVATQDGMARGLRSDVARSDAQGDAATEAEAEATKSLSIAVSSALLLALTVGLVQLIIYYFLAGGIIKSMGVTAESSMWYSALSYLKVRAATLWLVTNGIFRGLGDTRTPLIYSLAFTALNAILDPLFIFNLGFGASGAAAGTALAQYTALVPLLMALNRKTKIDFIGQFKSLGRTLKEYLEAGAYVLFRTFGKVLAYSVCARQAALLGPVAAAAYNLTFQLGFATTQICEAVAVAVQTLLAREIADTKSRSDYVRARAVRHLMKTSINLGGIVAATLSLTTYLQRSKVLAGLTSNLPVREAAACIMPAVLATQVLKGLAYPVNGIIMGGLDWKFTMIAMWAANIVCVAMVKFGGVMTLNKIWWALAAFMGVQVVTGILRFQSKTGVWSLLKAENKNST